MDCKECLSNPAYLCYCSNVHLCALHLGAHLQSPGDHNFEPLDIVLSPSERSNLDDELKSRITSLLKFQQAMHNKTKEAIKLLESKCSSLISKSKKMICEYLELMKRKKFTISYKNDIDSIMKNKLNLPEFDFNSLQTAIEEFYSNNEESLDNDSLRDKQINIENFLEEHCGSIRCVGIARDWKTLVTGSEDSSVRIWNLETLSQLACLVHHKHWVCCLDISQNGTFAATGSIDRTIALWNINERKLVKAFPLHSSAVYCVIFSDDTRNLISGTKNNEIYMWDIESLNCLKVLYIAESIRCGIIFSENLYAFGIGSNIQAIDLIHEKNCISYQGHTSQIRSIAKTNNLRYLFSGSSDTTIKIWDTYSKSLHTTFYGHSKDVLSIAISSDDRYLISGSCDFLVILWSLESMNQLHYFQYHLDIINSVISFQDFFVSVSRDGKIGVSRISTQLLENLIHLEPFTVKSEVYHEDIVAYGSGSEVRILDLNDSDVYCELKGHGDSVQSICLSSDLDFLVSSSLGPVNNLIVWNISNRSIKSILIGHSNSVFCVDISSDDLFAISGDAFSYVMQWDLTSMKQTCIFQGHSSFVHSVKFSPDRNFAVSAGNDLKVIVWNLNQKSIQSCFDGHPYPIWKVLITRDSRFIVSADYFTGIYVWNVEKKGHESTFNNLDEAENWLEQYSELKREVIYLLF